MNKKVLIIGGSSGMGLASAQQAYKEGYEVIIASRSLEKLKTAKKDIGDINIFPVDITDEKSIQALFDSVGKIDHLIIPGSEVQFGNIHTTSVEEAKKSFDSKFFGPFRVIQIGLNYFNSDASIVLFSGSSGTKPEKGTEILASINAAVESLARALALSLAPVRINVIAPGIIDTPPLLDALKDDTVRNLFEQFTNKIPVKRMGHADEIAEAVLYLMKNKYVTGTTLYVDGGHVIS
jgi:NAD(P)-dependent dehydrogenase (short-subunit alcohol dehydrogenase family)